MGHSNSSDNCDWSRCLSHIPWNIRHADCRVETIKEVTMNKRMNKVGITANIALLILLMISAFGCENKTQPQNTDSVMAERDSLSDELINEDGRDEAENETTNNDCMRGQPEPVIKKSVFPNATFTPQPIGHVAEERATLPNGDILIIRHAGCEYLVLTFRFETSRFRADTTNTMYWLPIVEIMMQEIIPGIDAPIDIPKAVKFIPLHLALLDSRPYELGEEMVVNNDIIREFVTLDRIQQVDDNRFAVELSFTRGAL